METPSKSTLPYGYVGRSLYTNPEAISRVSPSVVSLSYYSGDELGVNKSFNNGTIFSCKPDGDNARFVSYILTTYDLFITYKNQQKEFRQFLSQIEVCLPNKVLYEGEVLACDMKINVAIIKITSDESLPVATLTPFSDCISVCPFGVSESHAAFALSPYPTKVVPGDEVTVVSAKPEKTSHAYAFSGRCSVDRIRKSSDCVAFVGINAARLINGAPVINCEGDVIGVSFTVIDQCVAFLPVNVFFKWWKRVLTYGEICRPWIGMSGVNLYITSIRYLEAVVHDCGVYDGVSIDKVMHGSPAHSAGMHPGDVIYQCDGRPVRSVMEFIELLWDKSGEVIEVKGVRHGCHFSLKVEIKAIKTGLLPDELAKSLAENVIARKKSTKRTRNVKERADADADSDTDVAEKLEESKMTGILPAVEENVGTEGMKTEIMEVENAVIRKKSRKGRKNKTKCKEKGKKDKEGSGLKAKTSKMDERKKGLCYLSKSVPTLHTCN